MPLTVVRADANARLWDRCAGGFFDELPTEPGRISHPSHLWLAHRAQRDALLDAAEARGLTGWLAPPYSFFSDLPGKFGIEGRPLGHLTGRMLLGRLAARCAREQGFDSGGAHGRGHMVDRVLSELLPEGVSPDDLEAALRELPADPFGTRRNRWLVETYRAYRDAVESRGRFDPRSVHALLAERVRRGDLRAALGGATRLHVYGPTTLRGRVRLFRALAEQDEVDVRVYLPLEPEPGEWDALATAVEEVPSRGRGPVTEVQPAPDAVREAAWVARSIKALLVESEVEPHRVAVVARSGGEDTRRLREALRRAGVPSTARLRSRLSEVPALRALLHLFEGLAREWDGAALRPVLKSPYFDVDVDLRGIDFLETRARPRGLSDWLEGLRGLEAEAASERGWVLARSGVTETGVRRDLPKLEAFAEQVAPLATSRSEREWIETTRALMRGRPLGMRERVLTPVEDRWDVVRLDQSGTLALEGLLREWADLVSEDGSTLSPADWYGRLRRVLDSNELALSTPHQRGVQILEAHEAALTPFEHTFIVHANDGAFPRPGGGGLFNDDEATRLSELGIPLTTRDSRLESERRLWLACAAAKRTTVTYWTADSNGVPRLPSLFVPSHDRRCELPRTRREPAAEGTPAVTRDELLEREVVRFAAERRRGRLGEFSTPVPEALRRATLAAFADELRSGGLDAFADRALDEDADAAALFGNDRPLSERPTPWNGQIRDPWVLEVLARRFGAEREWSASWLEQYARRPFDFLLERVLGLAEAQPAEDEANVATVGGLVHAVLEAFYRDVDLPTDADGLSPPLSDRFESAFESTCRVWERSEDRWVGLPHVWSATRDELRERLRRFLDWELRQKDLGTPLAVELSFGHRSPHGPVDLSGPGRDGAEHRLLLRGRIDRVDRIAGDEAPALRVVDYKSGSSAPSPRAFDDASALQGVLYLAAVEALGLGEPALSVYRTVRNPGNRASRGAADVAPVLQLARQIPERVREGLFEGVQARSTELRDWQPGRDVVRTAARLSSGTRFDPIAPSGMPGARREAEGADPS